MLRDFFCSATGTATAHARPTLLRAWPSSPLVVHPPQTLYYCTPPLTDHTPGFTCHCLWFLEPLMLRDFFCSATGTVTVRARPMLLRAWPSAACRPSGGGAMRAARLSARVGCMPRWLFRPAPKRLSVPRLVGGYATSILVPQEQESYQPLRSWTGNEQCNGLRNSHQSKRATAWLSERGCEVER
eukprot:1159738-Pelagomonas_calceolata.AAC.9